MIDDRRLGGSYISQRVLSHIAKGVRVEVRSANPDLDRQAGTVIDSTPTQLYDCIVQLDERVEPLSFYWQEIIIT